MHPKKGSNREEFCGMTTNVFFFFCQTNYFFFLQLRSFAQTIVQSLSFHNCSLSKIKINSKKADKENFFSTS